MRDVGDVMRRAGDVGNHVDDVMRQFRGVVLHIGDVVPGASDVSSHVDDVVNLSRGAVLHVGDVMLRPSDVGNHVDDVMRQVSDAVLHVGDVMLRAGDVGSHLDDVMRQVRGAVLRVGDVVLRIGGVVVHVGDVVRRRSASRLPQVTPVMCATLNSLPGWLADLVLRRRCGCFKPLESARTGRLFSRARLRNDAGAVTAATWWVPAASAVGELPTASVETDGRAASFQLADAVGDWRIVS